MFLCLHVIDVPASIGLGQSLSYRTALASLQTPSHYLILNTLSVVHVPGCYIRHTSCSSLETQYTLILLCRCYRSITAGHTRRLSLTPRSTTLHRLSLPAQHTGRMQTVGPFACNRCRAPLPSARNK